MKKGGEMRKGRKADRHVQIQVGVLVSFYKSRIKKAGAGEFQVQGQARETI